MIKRIDYGTLSSGKVKITNDIGQEWEFKRCGLPISEMKAIIKEKGKDEGVSLLIEERKLIPVYGGDMHLV